MLTVYQEEKIIDYLDSFIYACGTEVSEMFQPKLFDCYDPISNHYYYLNNKVEGYEPLCKFCLKDVKKIQVQKISRVTIPMWVIRLWTTLDFRKRRRTFQPQPKHLDAHENNKAKNCIKIQNFPELWKI